MVALTAERTNNSPIDRNFDNVFAWLNAANLDQYIKADGTRPLSRNWDAGNWRIRARQFQSDVATGHPPLIVASTTLVDNLNADLLDGAEGASFLLVDGSRELTGDWDAGDHQIRAETFQSDIATGTAPLTVASTTLVDNLNADMLDGYHASSFVRGGGSGAADKIAYWSSADVITKDDNFSWDGQNLTIENIEDPTIKVAQKTTAAGGTLLWLTAAGSDSSSNSACVRYHNGGAIWGQTGGRGLYIGTYDKATTHIRIATDSTVYFSGDLQIGANSISNDGTGGITISAAGTVTTSGTLNATGTINANSTSMSIDADGYIKTKGLRFKSALSVGVTADKSFDLSTYASTSVIKFLPNADGYVVTIQNPATIGLYLFSNTTSYYLTLDFGDFTYDLPNHGRYFGLLAWYDGTQWNRTGDAY